MILNRSVEAYREIPGDRRRSHFQGATRLPHGKYCAGGEASL